MTCQYCHTQEPQWEHGAILGQTLTVGGVKLYAGTRMCIIGTEENDRFLHAKCGAEKGTLLCAIHPFWPARVLKLEGPWYTEEDLAERWKNKR